MTLTASNPIPLSIPTFTPSTLNFLESVEAAHSSHSFNDRVSSILGITRPPTRMDSQAKYCALARGDGGAYLRMPTGVGYKEKIWVRFVPAFGCLFLCLRRTTHLARYSLRNPGELSLIQGVSPSILDWGGPWVRTLALWPGGRIFILLCLMPSRRPL